MATDDQATATTRRKRTSKDTHERLILTTEQLIARRGVSGVSMRQIGQAAGLGNNSGVQYHFGTKEKLIEAVLAYRQPRLGARRRELMKAVRAHGELSLRQVLEVLLRPLTELVDEHGEHLHAQFLWQLQQPSLNTDLASFRPIVSRREDELPKMMFEALGHPRTPCMDVNVRGAFTMFLFFLISHDKLKSSAEGMELEAQLQITIDMIEAALVAAAKGAAA